MSRSISIAVVALALLPGCEGSESEVWSCEKPVMLSCTQWDRSAADEVTWARRQDACRAIGGFVAEGPCPEVDVIGVCTPLASSESRIVFYAPRPASVAQQTCARLGGTWR